MGIALSIAALYQMENPRAANQLKESGLEAPQIQETARLPAADPASQAAGLDLQTFDTRFKH